MTDIIIAGKRYPMHCSIAVTKAVAKKFGGMKEMGETMFKGREDEALDAVIFVAELLIRQGCEYKNLFEHNQPVPEDAPVDEDGNYVPITAETLEVALDSKDMQMLTQKIQEALFGPEERKVEAEEIKPKNHTAT